MLRKISFLAILCAVPSFAVSNTIGDYCDNSSGYWICSPGAGQTVGADSLLSGIDSSASGGSVLITNGGGIVVQNDGLNTDFLYIGSGYGGSASGNIYADVGTDVPFNLVSNGSVVINDTLFVLSGRIFDVQATNNAATINIGTIASSGELSIRNFASLTSGNITSNGNLYMDVGAIGAGTILHNSGTLDIITTNALTMDKFVGNASGLKTFNVGSITNSGDFQNNAGTADITVLGNWVNTGNLVNAGNMNVNVADISIGGVVNTGGDFNLNANNLTVSGGNWTNSGNLDLTVSGTTNVVGFDLSSMMANQIFSLTTGHLQITNIGTLFTSALDSFSVNVVNDLLSINDINNNGGAMLVSAQAITAQNITNGGDTLNLTATVGSIQVGAITTVSGSTTNIAAAGNLDTSVITNDGAMVLNGVNIVTGDVVNDATLSVFGNVLTTDTFTNNSGVANINTNTFNVDNLYVSGGVVNFSGANLISSGDITIDGNIAVGTAMLNLGNTNVLLSAENNISVVDIFIGKNTTFKAAQINARNATAVSGATIVFDTTKLEISSDLTSNGTIDLKSNDITIESLTGSGKFIVHGGALTATNFVLLSKGVWFDGTNPTDGFVVRDTKSFDLNSKYLDVSGGIHIGAGNTLNLTTTDNTNVSGGVVNDGTLSATSNTASINFYDDFNNTGIVNLSATDTATLFLFENSGTATVAADRIQVPTKISNDGTMSLIGTSQIAINVLENISGALDVFTPSFIAGSVNISDGAINMHTDDIAVIMDGINITGNFVQGSDGGGALNLLFDNTYLSATNLTVNGDFIANEYSNKYDVANIFRITGNMNVLADATVDIDPTEIIVGNVNNAGILAMTATNEITTGDFINSGTMDINSPLMVVNNFTTTGGATTIVGNELNATNSINIGGALYQNAVGALQSGDANIIKDNYIINTGGLTANQIIQNSGAMIINTNSLNVSGNIDANDLIFQGSANDWMSATIGGNVSNNVSFLGLGEMTIGGDYLFDDTSRIDASVLAGADYWATISLANDGTLGQITNDGSRALIEIDGKFTANVNTIRPDDSLNGGQFGINLFDTINEGRAIWLLHSADSGGLIEMGNEIIRELSVDFCNADGAVCFDYLTMIEHNGLSDDSEYPVYLSSRDTNGDGLADSIYVVFDPRFGGPERVLQIQPIVATQPEYTPGEYTTAGALDNLVLSQLIKDGWTNSQPLKAVPVAFRDTNMQQMANELYNRMVQYELDKNSAPLTNFSRLFTPIELQQITGSVALNEHTFARDFANRMFDEFIWNRNRDNKKFWLDFDFGMFDQKMKDVENIDGNRLSITAGIDWKSSKSVIFGIAGRVSHTASDATDSMDLSYNNTGIINGNIDVSVANTSVGIGAYFMKIFNDTFRLYGNAFMDLYSFDITREQNYMSEISGDGTAVALTSEFGLMHDWLNQYIVGNMYLRGGYNFGTTIAEMADDADYMNFETDGYFILTPGYSLTLQKRIYPSAFFQIRPYLSAGIEYDILGMNDIAQFKFAQADKFSDYSVEINPLWTNGGGGVELLGASGWQVGFDYRYQYNADIQMHKIKLSTSIRF